MAESRSSSATLKAVLGAREWRCILCPGRPWGSWRGVYSGASCPRSLMPEGERERCQASVAQLPVLTVAGCPTRKPFLPSSMKDAGYYSVQAVLKGSIPLEGTEGADHQELASRASPTPQTGEKIRALMEDNIRMLTYLKIKHC